MGASSYHYFLFYAIISCIVQLVNVFQGECFQSSSKIPFYAGNQLNREPGTLLPKVFGGPFESFSWFLSRKVVWQFIKKRPVVLPISTWGGFQRILTLGLDFFSMGVAIYVIPVVLPFLHHTYPYCEVVICMVCASSLNDFCIIVWKPGKTWLPIFSLISLIL